MSMSSWFCKYLIFTDFFFYSLLLIYFLAKNLKFLVHISFFIHHSLKTQKSFIIWEFSCKPFHSFALDSHSINFLARDDLNFLSFSEELTFVEKLFKSFKDFFELLLIINHCTFYRNFKIIRNIIKFSSTGFARDLNWLVGELVEISSKI